MAGDIADSIRLRRQSDAHDGRLGRFECYSLSAPLPAMHLRAGDRLLVDWSKKPTKGATGAILKAGQVRLGRLRGGNSTKVGRIVNSSMLLRT